MGCAMLKTGETTESKSVAGWNGDTETKRA